MTKTKTYPYPETDAELRADYIKKGDVIEEDGMEAYKVTSVQMHGDRVLLKGRWLTLDDDRKVIDSYRGDTSLDRDDSVTLLDRPTR